MKTEIRSLVFGFLGAAFFHFSHPFFIESAGAKDHNVLTVSGLNLVDSQGRLRVQVGFAKEGPPGMWFLDEKGKARIAMGLYPDGTSHFGLQDKQGQMIQLMRSIGAEESPLLIFKNRGQDKMIMGLNQVEQAPFLLSYEKDRKRKMIFGNYDGP